MIFSEFYGAYYNTIAAILTEAVAHPVSEQEMKRIIQQYAFEESKVTIPDAIRDDKKRWDNSYKKQTIHAAINLTEKMAKSSFL